MKNKVKIFSAALAISFLGLNTAKSQLKINAGGTLTTSNSAQIYLAGVDLINDGTINGAGSTIHFTGGNSKISGTGAVNNFENITVNKTAGTTLTLETNIAVADKLTFVSGDVELNGRTIALGNTGSLVNETETNRIKGTTGGSVTANANLNAPNGVNIGNLGAVLTSASNLGVVNIVRSHASSNIAAGGGKSLLRSYDITPTNNTNVNTTVRLNYFDAELNGLTESNFSMFKNSGGGFVDLGFTSRSAVDNYVIKDAINSFSVFTLSAVANPLPISLAKFESKCNNNIVDINWETSYEKNVQGFELQKSTNASEWTLLATANAQNQGNEAISYNIADKSSNFKNNYYRLISYELDGTKNISKIISAACAAKANARVSPNPVVDITNLEIAATESKSASMKLINVNGQLLQSQKLNLTNTTNTFPINMASVPAGVYFLEILQADGATEKLKVIKK